MKPPPHPRSSFWTRALAATLGVGALTAAGSLLATTDANSAVPPTRERAVPTVAVAEAQTKDHRRKLSFSGALQAVRRAELAFTLPGRMTQRTVKLGDRVHKGQLVATLDRRSLKRSVEAAAAANDRAREEARHSHRQSRRMTELSASGAVATQTAEDAQSAFTVRSALRRQAKNELGRARRALAEGSLNAPFSGFVSRVGLEVGEFATPGRTVVEVVDDSQLELEVEVPESILGSLATGQAVQVDLPMLSHSVQGELITIGAATRQRAALFPVVIRIRKTEGLRPGVTAQLVLDQTVARGLSVPVEAVVDRTGQAPRVFTVESGLAVAHPVEVLALAAGSAIISSVGLAPGDRVITTGHARIVEGETVAVHR